MFSLLITIMAQSGPPDTAEQSGSTEAWWELLCTGVPTSPSPGTGPVSLRPITMLDPCWAAGGGAGCPLSRGSTWGPAHISSKLHE